MTVTKQQQLERISRIIPTWNDAYLYAELMTNPSINMTAYRFTDNPSGDNAFITREEWKQERDRQAELKAMTMQMCELKPLGRDKMQKQEADDVRIFHFVDDETLAANIEAMKALGATLVTPHKQDNSWHERGEFPPAGVVCEVLNNELYNPEWEKCTIIFMGNYKCIYSSETRSEVVGDVYSTGAIEFRPLSTEREKAIDEMIAAIDHIKEGNFQTFIGALYDAGYRKVSP